MDVGIRQTKTTKEKRNEGCHEKLGLVRFDSSWTDSAVELGTFLGRGGEYQHTSSNCSLTIKDWLRMAGLSGILFRMRMQWQAFAELPLCPHWWLSARVTEYVTSSHSHCVYQVQPHPQSLTGKEKKDFWDICPGAVAYAQEVSCAIS